MSKERELLRRLLENFERPVTGRFGDLFDEVRELLSTPEPEQDDKPVAWISHNGFRFNADIEPIEHKVEVALYLHPAPRSEFMRLSKKEVNEILSLAHTPYEAICATENMLVRKNTINKSDPDSVDLQSRCRGDKP